MTPSEAAQVIGCSESHVRLLIRTGKLQAEQVVTTRFGQYKWHLDAAEVRRFRRLPKPKRGFPRGKKRT